MQCEQISNSLAKEISTDRSLLSPLTPGSSATGKLLHSSTDYFCLVAKVFTDNRRKSPTDYRSRIGDKKKDVWEPNADTPRGPTNLLLSSNSWGFLMIMHQTHLTVQSHVVQSADHGQRRLSVNPTRELPSIAMNQV